MNIIKTPRHLHYRHLKVHLRSDARLLYRIAQNKTNHE